MSVTPLRRACARLVIAVAGFHVVAIGALAVRELGGRLAVARAYRHEPFAAAQERLLGRDYVASIRRIRAVVPVHETVYLVDEEEAPSGGAYFALHYLAPRRVVYLGAPARESPKLVRSRLPADARWVVVAGAPGEPLALVAADELRPKGSRRGD